MGVILRGALPAGRHVSTSLAATSGLTNQYLKDPGLVSVKLWVNMYYPDTAR